MRSLPAGCESTSSKMLGIRWFRFYEVLWDSIKLYIRTPKYGGHEGSVPPCVRLEYWNIVSRIYIIFSQSPQLLTWKILLNLLLSQDKHRDGNFLFCSFQFRVDFMCFPVCATEKLFMENVLFSHQTSLCSDIQTNWAILRIFPLL